MGYVWSPLAPSPSGIANYVETLISEDPEFADLTFVTQDPDQREGRNALAPEGHVRLEDKALLQLGNNVHHGFILERARLGGAIVELHDLSLHHLHTELTLAKKDFPGYLAGLQESEGDWGRRAAFQRAKGFYSPRLDFYMRVNRTICERARAVIVHSNWAKFQIELQDVETPIHVLPHYALKPEESHATSRSRAEARRRLGLDPDSFMVLVAGYVTPAKRVDWVLDAVHHLLDAGHDLRLVVAGACEMEQISELILQSPHREKIKITGYLDAAAFDEYTLAADIMPLMRFPSAGESSGVAARALGFGRVIVVPEYAAFSDLPDAICEKVQLDEPVVPQLVSAIERYVAMPERQAAMEKRVGDYAARHLSLDGARTGLKSILAKYWA
ncbi:MAG: glycosyltransferase [Pseudomonadota bacterium]